MSKSGPADYAFYQKEGKQPGQGSSTQCPTHVSTGGGPHALLRVKRES